MSGSGAYLADGRQPAAQGGGPADQQPNVLNRQ